MTQFWYPQGRRRRQWWSACCVARQPYFDQMSVPIKGIATERQTEADGRFGGLHLYRSVSPGYSRIRQPRVSPTVLAELAPLEAGGFTLRERGISSAVMTQVSLRSSCASSATARGPISSSAKATEDAGETRRCTKQTLGDRNGTVPA